MTSPILNRVNRELHFIETKSIRLLNFDKKYSASAAGRQLWPAEYYPELTGINKDNDINSLYCS